MKLMRGEQKPPGKEESESHHVKGFVPRKQKTLKN